MSVLSRMGDAVAVRSLVAGREPDFLRCSANLLHYCVQVTQGTYTNDTGNREFDSKFPRE